MRSEIIYGGERRTDSPDVMAEKNYRHPTREKRSRIKWGKYEHQTVIVMSAYTFILQSIDDSGLLKACIRAVTYLFFAKMNGEGG